MQLKNLHLKTKKYNFYMKIMAYFNKLDIKKNNFNFNYYVITNYFVNSPKQ